MKKLLLFITVALMGFSMTSCLNDGSQQFNERSIVYITQQYGKVYGKTLSGKIITAPKMQTMDTRSFKFFNYSWDEEFGMTEIGDFEAYNVAISGLEIDIAQTTIMDIPVESETPDHRFMKIFSPAHDPNGLFFDDFWLFEYTFRGVEGDKATVDFHIREFREDDDMVIVDLRLDKYEVGKENAMTRDYANIIAVDLGELRHEYLRGDRKEINIQFFYHGPGNDPITVRDDEFTGTEVYKMISKEQEIKPEA